jgi:HEPN domain-containing protein
MGIPQDRTAKAYYFAAVQRREDARHLLAAGRTTGAVYMAGYCVECALKALILVETPARRRPAVQAELITHSYATLRHLYATRCGGTLTRQVARDLTILNTWSSEMRYDASNIRMADAEALLAAVDRIWAWVDARV